jgi:hypothetical protein
MKYDLYFIFQLKESHDMRWEVEFYGDYLVEFEEEQEAVLDDKESGSSV